MAGADMALRDTFGLHSGVDVTHSFGSVVGLKKSDSLQTKVTPLHEEPGLANSELTCPIRNLQIMFV
jgi:hypothetical protein